jgi:two-component system, NarL family, nitrate/nitrite response regulator NarL
VTARVSVRRDEVLLPQILIVCDVRLYREGLAQSLTSDGRVRVLGSATSVADALMQIRDTPPDVVVLDVAIRNSLDLPRAILSTTPATRVVAFALHDGEHDVLQCAEAGIAGYVPRDGSLSDLVEAIEGAVRGEVICSPRTAATLFRRLASLSSQPAPASEDSVLTAREIQIVELIDQGLANKEIAQLLSIGTATVKNHVHHILEKLQVTRRAEAAARLRTVLARRRGAHLLPDRRQRA